MGKTEKVIGALAVKIFKGFVLEKDVIPSPDDLKNISSILVVIRHQMGDMLCSLPMLYSLKAAFPGAKITLVTKRSSKFTEVFTGNALSPADEVIMYEHGFENFIELVKNLRLKNFGLAVVPASVDFSDTNHLISYFSQAVYRSGVRSKDYEANNIAYTLNIKNDFLWDTQKVHQIERSLDLIRQLGIKPAENNIRLGLTVEQNNFASDFFEKNFSAQNSPVIGLHAGAAKGQNIWPAEKFAALMQLLYEKFNCSFYISEGPDDRHTVGKLEAELKSKCSALNYSVYCGDLMNNAANISKTALFVSNDTGIMHLASGFDIPVIGLFGPTKAYEWGPLGNNKASIQSKSGNISDIEITDVFETCKRFLIV